MLASAVAPFIIDTETAVGLLIIATGIVAARIGSPCREDKGKERS